MTYPIPNKQSFTFIRVATNTCIVNQSFWNGAFQDNKKDITDSKNGRVYDNGKLQTENYTTSILQKY